MRCNVKIRAFAISQLRLSPRTSKNADSIGFNVLSRFTLSKGKLTTIEGFRRIVAAACLFAGICLVLQPGGPLVVARVVDFSREYSTSPYISTGSGTLADFIRRRTEGRVIDATGSPWGAFATALRDGTATGHLQRLPLHPGQAALVFRPETIPGPLDSRLSPFSYVHLPSEDLWISLSLEHAQDIVGLDRRWAFPHRQEGLWLVPLAFVIYFILPRKGAPPDALVYSQIPAVVLPDMLGLLGGAFFLALPLMILAENAPGQPPWSLEGGWAWLTLLMGLMSAGFLSLMLVGFRYATPPLAIDRARLETGHLAEIAIEMARDIPLAALRGDQAAIDALARRDDDLDDLQTAILEYLAKIDAATLPPREQTALHQTIALVNTWENIGDILDAHILDIARDRLQTGHPISPATHDSIAALHQALLRDLQLSLLATTQGLPHQIQALRATKAPFNALAQAADRALQLSLPGRDPQRLKLFRLESDLINNLKHLHHHARRPATLLAP